MNRTRFPFSAPHLAAVCLLAGLCLLPSATPAAVLFLDDMTGDAGGAVPQGNWTSTYHTADTGTDAGVFGSLVSDANDPGANSLRLFFGTPGSSSRQGMFLTLESAFASAVPDRAIGNYTSGGWLFSYYSRNDNSPVDRLAIRVDSTWYVRNTPITQNGSVTNGGQTWLRWEMANPFGSSGWTALSTDSGNGSFLDRLTVSGGNLTGTDVLPSTGNLTGVGYWGSATTNYGMRLDLFEVQATAIPEPSSALATLGGLGLLLLFRRRAP